MIRSRPYNGADHLQCMLTMLAETTRQHGDCGLMHVGDVTHRIYNPRRRQPVPEPSKYVRVWEHDDEVVGFAIYYPYQESFDFVVHSDHRGTELEAEIITTAETATWKLMQKHGYDASTVAMDVDDCDKRRAELAESLGYSRAEPIIAVTERSLDIEIPQPKLPAGFSIRSAEGTHEALALGKVHSGAFGSAWTEEEYRAVMESPGYDASNELVVVAPDGEFAAFTINWFDHLNKTALFEPVGVHEDYQRKGLGRALMYYALRRMKGMGIERAYVCHEVDNPASSGLYAAVGFQHKYIVYDYRKTMT